MKFNAIDLLNSPLNIGALIGFAAVWFALWHVILKRILKRCKVTSIWYELYGLGAFGTMGIVLFLLIVTALFVGSIQAVATIGIKLLFPLFIFWGGFVAIVVLIIRAIRKK